VLSPAPLTLVFSGQVIGHSRCHEQLPARCVLLHPRRDVDRIAEGSEVDHRAPNVAHECDARIDCHA
jgi:hypothetical protein